MDERKLETTLILSTRRMQYFLCLGILWAVILVIKSNVDNTANIPIQTQHYTNQRYTFPIKKNPQNNKKEDPMKYPPVVLNPPKLGQKYAIFSGSTPAASAKDPSAFNYIFYLPLTVRSWKRLGFGSIIVLTGDVIMWEQRSILNVVFKELMQLNTTLVFLPCNGQSCNLIAMVARLFVASLVPWDAYSTKIQKLSATEEAPSLNNTLLLTTDADLWPLNADMYHFPGGHITKILVTNSDCCGNFAYSDGNKYSMLAMSTITMSVETWREVMFPYGDFSNITTSSNIIEHIQNLFPRLKVYKKVVKGSKVWYIDQKLVSFRVGRWLKGKQLSFIKGRSRRIFADRLDRAKWKPTTLGAHIFDSHLLVNGFLKEKWEQIVPLLKYMYLTSKSLQKDFSKSIEYRESFRVKFEALRYEYKKLTRCDSQFSPRKKFNRKC